MNKANEQDTENTHREKGVPTSWGKVAEWYDEHLHGEDTYHQKVLLPNILRLVSPTSGMHILDLACGQGFFTQAFISAGATVTGIDIAPELIEKARAHVPTAIFFVSPADNLSAIPDASIDHVVIVLAAQNIQEFDGMCKEVSRVLKTTGAFSLVLNHPAFRIPKASSWDHDGKSKTQYRRIDAYLSESRTEIDMHPGSDKKDVTISFHRPLQWYAKHLTKHGFVIDRLEEWTSHKTSVGKHRDAENKARKEIPLFLYLRLKKLA